MFVLAFPRRCLMSLSVSNIGISLETYEDSISLRTKCINCKNKILTPNENAVWHDNHFSKKISFKLLDLRVKVGISNYWAKMFTFEALMAYLQHKLMGAKFTRDVIEFCGAIYARCSDLRSPCHPFLFLPSVNFLSFMWSCKTAGRPKPF